MEIKKYCCQKSSLFCVQDIVFNTYVSGVGVVWATSFCAGYRFRYP